MSHDSDTDASAQHPPSRKEALLTAIIEGSDDAIISKDLNGTIISWNPGARDIFGYTAGEAMGEPITMLMPEGRKQEEEQILGKLKRGEKVENFETVRKRKDGTLLHVSLTVSPIRDESGDIVGASKIARDITRRIEAERELREVNATLEERVEERTQSLISYQEQLRSLATRLSRAEEQQRQELASELHDNLGQMLAVSKMKMDFLSNSSLSGESAEQIEDVRQGIEEALIYTRNLMSDLKPPPTLDREDVTETIEWLAEKMEKHDLEVRLEDDGEPKRTSEDIRTTLLQCVRELLFNIIKHTDEEKALVKMWRKGERVHVCVTDEGPGLQYSESPSESEANGGFGLFNIRERIDLLGGRTEIESDPGNGTSITLIAPLKEVTEAEKGVGAGGEEPVAPKDSPCRRINVMLVDDHRMMRQGLKELLEKEEDMIVVAEASGGREAIEQARKAEPDVILMDIEMPDIDGIEATRELKKALPGASIVGLSVHEEEQTVEKLYEAGASSFLSKEEAPETLLASIRSER